MDKRFLSILAAIIVIFIGIFIFTQGGDEGGKSTNSSNTPSTTNHVLGDNQKNVHFVEYGDYQCPVCQSFHQPLKEAVEKNKADIKFQFSHLPLTAIHQNAFAAARAAEAASMQNKFWEMHDLLYAPVNWQAWTQSTNPVPLFESYAKSLKLDASKFKQDYASEEVNDLINADLAAFAKTGKQKATPAFFINGQFVENKNFLDSTGRPSAEKIDQYLKSQINKP